MSTPVVSAATAPPCSAEFELSNEPVTAEISAGGRPPADRPAGAGLSDASGEDHPRNVDVAVAGHVEEPIGRPRRRRRKAGRDDRARARPARGDAQRTRPRRSRRGRRSRSGPRRFRRSPGCASPRARAEIDVAPRRLSGRAASEGGVRVGALDGLAQRAAAARADSPNSSAPVVTGIAGRRGSGRERRQRRRGGEPRRREALHSARCSPAFSSRSRSSRSSSGVGSNCDGSGRASRPERPKSFSNSVVVA